MTPMQKFSQLLVATRNPGKIGEFAEMLAGLQVSLRDLSEFPHVPEAEESGTTFSENAALKAGFYSAQTGLWTLADDSGLEVDALGGAPGVFSARYAGAGATALERIEQLLAELAATNDGERRARFVCVIALAHPATTRMEFFSGVCEGCIAPEPRGTGGFGYDPVFIPDGYTQTFGELPALIKNRFSHRAHALQAANAFLQRRIDATQLDPKEKLPLE